MLLKVKDFCYAVQNDINGLTFQLQKETARNMTPRETAALQSSYKAVSNLFGNVIKNNPLFAQVNISTTNMFLEYKLPSASSWCDLVLIGNNKDENPRVVIIELKDWMKNNNDQPSEDEGLIVHNGEILLHPSEQVRGYTEYCQRFHSTVLDYNAKVSGVVFFSQDIDITPYTLKGNAQLTKEYPMFNTTELSVVELSNILLDKIDRPNESFAEDFKKGYYKQDRDILKQVAELLQKNKSKGELFSIVNPFVLLEEQKKGFNLVMSSLKNLKEGQKEVIIVKGPPGCGKSAIAINVWIQTAIKYGYHEKKGNVVFATTSSSQFCNWKHIFKKHGGRNAAGMIIKSTKFNPGIYSSNVNSTIINLMREINEEKYIGHNEDNDYLKKEYYKEYTDILIDQGTSDYKDNLHFITIVDEAHSLFNPMNPDYVQSSNQWMQQAGPQAYHIIRESNVSVFFMDDMQSFRDIETTSVSDICKIAKEMKINPIIISLEDMQFRCAGSRDYIKWVDALFSEKPLKNHETWKNIFPLNIAEYPSDLEQLLREKFSKGETVRLLSSYTENWKSKGKIKADHSNQDEVPFDFELEDKDGKVWKKYWNAGGLVKTDPDYSMFVQGNGSIMSEDPLSEVGCAYVVRGFDYDSIGVLWIDDIIIRNGKWVINIEKCKETTIKRTIFRAKKEIEENNVKDKYYPAYDYKFPECNKLFKAIAHAYRILLTRPIKSVSLYISDKETREYVKSLL